MYSWGSASNGELGLGGLEDPNISLPTQIRFRVQDVKVGSLL